MNSRISFAALALVAGLNLTTDVVRANETEPSSQKVLAGKNSDFNLLAIEEMLKEGDKAVSRGKLSEARKKYDKARTISKQLLSFYRDLGGSFRGLDARVPREMDQKGRRTLELLADSNLRLAALFRRQNKPEVAVPVLVEVVRLMTPAKSQGKKAYQALLEIGFVDTPYLGGAF
tara:strand:+ start:1734 stop:2258 length:525 start_codon:yes stop_codon:yes gene_type:complete